MYELEVTKPTTQLEPLLQLEAGKGRMEAGSSVFKAGYVLRGLLEHCIVYLPQG